MIMEDMESITPEVMDKIIEMPKFQAILVKVSILVAHYNHNTNATISFNIIINISVGNSTSTVRTCITD